MSTHNIGFYEDLFLWIMLILKQDHAYFVKIYFSLFFHNKTKEMVIHYRRALLIMSAHNFDFNSELIIKDLSSTI